MKLAIAALAAALLTPGPLAEPLETFNNRLFLAVQVNGRPVEALLDSGAEMSVLDDGFAADLGLAAAGDAAAHGSGAQAMRARFVQGVDIAAARVVLLGRTVAVLDLDEVSERLIGRRVDMILGRELFDEARWRIDIEGESIESVSRAEAPPGTRHPLTAHRGIETFPVRIDGREAAAVFDLGNGSEVMIGRAFAERLGLAAPDRVVERRRGGGLGGAVERDIVLLPALALGGRTFRDVPAAIDDSPDAADLNIGTSVLRAFLITVDFRDRSLWLAQRPPC